MVLIHQVQKLVSNLRIVERELLQYASVFAKHPDVVQALQKEYREFLSVIETMNKATEQYILGTQKMNEAIRQLPD